jgi:hypothetical protein
MGLFDDIVPPDTASGGYRPLRITVRPKGVEPPPAPPQLDDRPAGVDLAPNQVEPWGIGEGPKGNVAPSPRTGGLFDDIVVPAAQHKAVIERALSTTVPLRLQHPHAVEIASELMADHGMPLDEALDRATMRLHAEEGTAGAGKISDIIGKDVFDEAQRAPAPSDLAQPAPGVGQGRAAIEEQVRPDGEHASGDSAPQGGDAAGGKTIGSEGAGPTDNRAQFRGALISAAVKGEGGDQGFAFGRNDAIVARTLGEQHVLPTIERIGGEAYTRRAAHGEFDPKLEEEPPDKGPPSDEIKQANLLATPRPQGGVFDSATNFTAIDFFNQLAAPELARSQALTDYVQQHPRAAAAEGALGLGVVLGIPAAGAAGLLGAGAAAATFGSAGSKYYRTTFFKANPKLRGQVVVHHAVEQQAMKRYPGVVADAEIHSLENLRGIPRHLNSELHLRQIQREWARFYRENPTATRRQLLQKATEIDAKYGSQFNPPIKPGR